MPVVHSTIKTTQQLLEITDVSDIEVTPTVQDPDVGDYVRDIRIFGADDGTNKPLVVQLRIRSTTEDAIAVSSPAREF